VKRGAATIAIVRTRLRKELGVAVLTIFACALLAYLQRYDVALEQLAGALAASTLAGIAIGTIQRGTGRFRQFELCEQSAPLFGRELARATALVPCIIVAAAIAAYWIVAAAFGHLAPAFVAISFAGGCSATLVALGASVTAGTPRAIFIICACLAGGLAFALAREPFVLPLLFCAFAGFVGLRQYGEALAHYEPI
jgi:hypothetical protein